MVLIRAAKAEVAAEGTVLPESSAVFVVPAAALPKVMVMGLASAAVI